VESQPDVVPEAFVMRGTRVPDRAIVDNVEGTFMAK
jgi:hypothetical protein